MIIYERELYRVAFLYVTSIVCCNYPAIEQSLIRNTLSMKMVRIWLRAALEKIKGVAIGYELPEPAEKRSQREESLSRSAIESRAAGHTCNNANHRGLLSIGESFG